MSIDPFLGEIQAFPYNFIPKGWMACEGQLLPLAPNSALFSLLGINYGGDGKSTFGIPDLRGFAMAHPDIGIQAGGRYGEAQVTLTQAEMGTHNHMLQREAAVDPITGKTAAPNANSNYGGINVVISPGVSEVPPHFVAVGPANTSLHPSALGPAGGNQPHENRQPYLAMTYCIATQGEYPQRA